MDWADMAQDKDKWQALVNTVMTFQSYAIREISWQAEKILASLKDSAPWHLLIRTSITNDHY